jgi:hypothetical protein
MKGRVVVQPNTAVGGAVELLSGGSFSGSATREAVLGASVMLALATAGGVLIWRRKRETLPKPNSVS